MTFRSLAFAGLILLALPACTTSPAVSAIAPQNPLGVDLGSSSRVPRTQLAMAGSGHDAHRLTADDASAQVQLVHDDAGNARATGTVNAVDLAAHKINLSHQPITSLGWPAMTMDFPVAPSVDLKGIKPGSRVNFSLEKGKDGMYQIETLQPAGQ